MRWIVGSERKSAKGVPDLQSAFQVGVIIGWSVALITLTQTQERGLMTKEAWLNTAQKLVCRTQFNVTKTRVQTATRILCHIKVQ
jgi:hypothetical protein